MPLYKDMENNTLLNDVFLYIFHNLPSLQNMHAYRLTKDLDIETFVHTRFPKLVGPPPVPETYLVSKELVAYIETLIAFTPYYRADDHRMSGKMEIFYQKAFSRYQHYPYDEFHKYITKKLTSFYDRFELSRVSVKEEPVVTGSPKEGDVVEAGPLPDGGVVAKPYCMSGSEDEGEDTGAAAAAASPVDRAAAAAKAPPAAPAPAAEGAVP